MILKTDKIACIIHHESLITLTDNPFRYSSYYTDRESGLNYCQARYYSPDMMAFTSRDTYDLQNRYAYCDADPVGKTDKNGHLPLHSLLNTIFLGFSTAVHGLTCGSHYRGDEYEDSNKRFYLALAIWSAITLGGQVLNDTLNNSNENCNIAASAVGAIPFVFTAVPVYFFISETRFKIYNYFNDPVQEVTVSPTAAIKDVRQSDLTWEQADQVRERIPCIDDESMKFPECPICIDKIKNEDKIAFSPCEHVFHQTCLSRWMAVNPTCPMDRGTLMGSISFTLNTTTFPRKPDLERPLNFSL